MTPADMPAQADEGWWQQRLSRPARQCAIDALRQHRGLAEEDLDELADQAQAGVAQAEAYLTDTYGRREQPTDYATALELRVVPVGSNGPLQLPYFSMYDERQQVIEVNMTLIRRLERYLVRVGRAELVPDDRLRQVAVAHELYHDVEQRLRPQPTSLAQRWRQRAQTARLDAVGEVAAVWFSQVLLGLEYSPTIYFDAAARMGAGADGAIRPVDGKALEGVGLGSLTLRKWRGEGA